MYRKVRHIFAVLLTAVFAAGAVSCSPNKNNAATRKYQAFITRYNVYYNGDKHYKETLADMERLYEDDYSQRLYMHPVEAKNDASAPQPSGDFNRSIEKAQKAIQIRSIKKKPARKSGKGNDPAYKEWLKREEYNPFLHNAWMMMGRGQYYNGDFLGAASTFFYVSRHFKWLPATVTESKLMQALCYVSLGWQFEAEMILTRIKKDELTNNRLRRLYNFVYADWYLHADNYEDALPFLQESVKGASGPQKTRLNFLTGQVLQKLGRNEEAYKAFDAAGSASSAPYRTKFNARIKQSEVYVGSDIEPEIKALKRMVRYDRNKDYLDQVYYAIGNLYLSRGDTAHAIESYETANEKSTRNGVDKAVNQIKLGQLYFEQGNYAKAQPNFSDAVPLLPTTFANYDLLKRRSDVLDELAVYSENVTLQDSLLRLSAMPEDQLEAVIAKIIADLKEKERKEAEEARREEYLANRVANGGLQDNNTQSFTINSDNSWYFYNTATKNAGKTEFQKRWGSRKLEDDWRRRNKSSFNTDDFDVKDGEDEDVTPDTEAANDGDVEEKESKVDAHADDPHFPQYYMSQIPKTDEEKATAHEIIQEGLYNMGVILKDKLEDFDASKKEFDRLLADYPDNVYRLDAYYNLYLMFMRQGKTAEAEKYRRMILSDFADSKYGIAMADPNYIENLRMMDARQQEMYDRTYEAYMANRNSEVHRNTAEMAQKYPLSKIMPKFMFLDALAYVTEKNSEAFNATLRELLEKYPDTDITPVASAWLKGMAQGRELRAGSTNMRGMIWDLRLSNDSIAGGGTEGPAEFELNPDARQTLVFTFATDKVSSNALLYEIARHNFRSFVVKDFDIEPMNFGRLGMIVVRGFENRAELEHYCDVMARSGEFRLPAGVRPIAISEANLQMMIEQGRSFDEYFRYLEEQNYVDAQTGLLETEDIEELPAEDVAEEKAVDEDINVDGGGETVEDVPGIVPEAAPVAPVKVEVPDAPVSPASPLAPQPVSPAKMTQDKPVKPAVPKSEPNKPTPAPIIPGNEGDDDPLLLPDEDFEP